MPAAAVLDDKQAEHHEFAAQMGKIDEVHDAHVERLSKGEDHMKVYRTS